MDFLRLATCGDSQALDILVDAFVRGDSDVDSVIQALTASRSERALQVLIRSLSHWLDDFDKLFDNPFQQLLISEKQQVIFNRASTRAASIVKAVSQFNERTAVRSLVLTLLANDEVVREAARSSIVRLHPERDIEGLVARTIELKQEMRHSGTMAGIERRVQKMAGIGTPGRAEVKVSEAIAAQSALERTIVELLSRLGAGLSERGVS